MEGMLEQFAERHEAYRRMRNYPALLPREWNGQTIRIPPAFIDNVTPIVVSLPRIPCHRGRCRCRGCKTLNRPVGEMTNPFLRAVVVPFLGGIVEIPVLVCIDAALLLGSVFDLDEPKRRGGRTVCSCTVVERLWWRANIDARECSDPVPGRDELSDELRECVGRWLLRSLKTTVS
jgi:hypothetical protein